MRSKQSTLALVPKGLQVGQEVVNQDSEIIQLKRSVNALMMRTRRAVCVILADRMLRRGNIARGGRAD